MFLRRLIYLLSRQSAGPASAGSCAFFLRSLVGHCAGLGFACVTPSIAARGRGGAGSLRSGERLGASKLRSSESLSDFCTNCFAWALRSSAGSKVFPSGSAAVSPSSLVPGDDPLRMRGRSFGLSVLGRGRSGLGYEGAVGVLALNAKCKGVAV